MTGQTAVRNTGVLSLPQGLVVERQRLLIREADYLRTIDGVPPVRGEDGDIATTAPVPRNLAEPEPAPATDRMPIALHCNRRAILRAVAVALERAEEPTRTFIRTVSEIPERGAAAAPKCEADAGLPVNRAGLR